MNRDDIVRITDGPWVNKVGQIVDPAPSPVVRILDSGTRVEVPPHQLKVLR